MDELIQVALPAGEPVAEVVTEAAPALDPQQVADAANFAGMLADDPDATQRYLDSLLRLMEMADDAGRLMEVLPLW
ncbi:MAG: hypothetical protein ACM3X0_11390 [Bacteroidota bacterium]